MYRALVIAMAVLKFIDKIATRASFAAYGAEIATNDKAYKVKADSLVAKLNAADYSARMAQERLTIESKNFSDAMKATKIAHRRGE